MRSDDWLDCGTRHVLAVHCPTNRRGAKNAHWYPRWRRRYFARLAWHTISVCLCLLITGCQSVGGLKHPGDPRLASELTRTWDAAWVYFELDGSIFDGDVATLGDSLPRWAISGAAPRRVLVFLHGCDGLWPKRHASLWRMLAQSGFLVVMPNSFARSHRPSQCGRQTAWVYAARLAEIDYAREQLATVMAGSALQVSAFGHSEGAVALVRHTGRGFVSAVVTGTGCTRFELLVSTLAVMSEDDRALHGGTCTQAAHRLLLSGDQHDVLAVDEAQQTIYEFLSGPAELP